MSEVNGRILQFALDLGRAGGVDEATLLHDLPSVAMRDGVPPRWFAWSDFALLWERLEDALGGPEGFAVAARRAVPTAYPEFRAFAGVFVTPMSLFAFMMLRHMPTSFRNVEIEELGRTEEQIHWRVTVLPPHRGCEAFHRSTRSFATLIPLHLALPEGTAEITRMTPNVAEFVADFGPARPFAMRGRHAVSVAKSLAAAQLDEAFSLVARRARAGQPPPESERSALAAKWAKDLSLSRRQAEVFALVLEGRQNKEISVRLKCSLRTVEYHVGRILRAAGLTSRSELLVRVLGANA